MVSGVWLTLDKENRVTIHQLHLGTYEIRETSELYTITQA